MRKQIVLLLTLVLLSGCASGSSNTAQSESTGSNVKLDDLSIYVENVFNDEYGNIDEEALIQWEDYMGEKYSTNITLEKERTFENMYTTQIYCLNANEIFTKILNNTAIPLDEYLADNKTWNLLPESFKKTFEYNGHIWAIPRSTDIMLNVSSIRTDWLKKVGLPIPQTQEELFEVGKSFVKSDANSNGNLKDDYLIGINNALCVDIFNSFGIYLSQTASDNFGYVPISYDPTMDCVTDSMFKPEAKAAFEYLRNMYNSGLIDLDAFWGDNMSNQLQGLYGTVQTTLTGGKYNVSDQYEALPPLSKQYPIIYSSFNEGFTLNPLAKNKKEAINLFIDMAFGSVSSYLDFSLGITDSYTIKSNKSIRINYKDEENKTFYTKSGLIDLPEIMIKDYYFINGDQNVNEAKSMSREIQKYESDYIDKYTSSKQLVKIPVWYSAISNRHYIMYGSALKKAFNKALTSIPQTDISIDDIILEYKKTVLSLDMGGMDYKTFIESINKEISKKSLQTLE